MSDPDYPSSAGPHKSNATAQGVNSTVSVFDRRNIGGKTAWARISTSVSDDEWDTFLQTLPFGQFQQSSLWAAVKTGDGWHPLRVIIRQDEIILGGFQILFRSRKMIREGYLNKGPVYREADPDLLNWLLDLIERTARSHGIDVLVLQAPDDDQSFTALQNQRRYAANGLASIITATFCIPLGRDLPPAETRMRRTVRLEARQAVRRGVVIREGGVSDIPAFFEMMCVTCRRQETSPNPSSEGALLRLWSVFVAKRLARLTIAECDGKPTAGLLTLRFGTRVTQWKKGWNEEFREKHPNTLLAFESIQWAERHGGTCVDFVGGDRAYAHAILDGKVPSEDLRASRYFFLLGFGAEPRLLPLGRVFVPNPLARAAYRLSLPFLRKLGRIEAE